MKWPTTLILLATIASATALGIQGSIDGAAVTSILGTVVGAVGVGHYVKTTLNGSSGQTFGPPNVPGATTRVTATTTVPGGEIEFEERAHEEPEAP